MALIIADRVQETTTTTGTGTINLAGASVQYQTFISAIGNGNTTYYGITSGNGSDWEVGIGTVTSGTPNTLSRTTIIASSNSGAAITLSGTSTVFGNAPAALLSNGGLYGAGMYRPAPTGANTGLTNWINQGTGSVTDTAAGIFITAPGGATDSCRIRYRVAPIAPYTITALVALECTQQNYQGIALGWSDGTTTSSKLHAISYEYASGFGDSVAKWTNCTTFSAADSAHAVTGNFCSGPGQRWLQIRDDGTSVYFNTSADGINFRQIFTVTKASGWLGSSGYSNVIVYVNRINNTGSTTAYGTIMSWSQA